MNQLTSDHRFGGVFDFAMDRFSDTDHEFGGILGRTKEAE
jgi:hypothetical protein